MTLPTRILPARFQPAWLFPAPRPDAQESALAGRGPDGNSRLTSATGIVLIAVLAVEAVTLLSVRQMITLHIFVGMLLIGPVLLKVGSTLYRFTRYYTREPAYHRAGPPPLVLRILGPVLVLATVGLLGTGVLLIFTGDHRDDGWLTLHQTFFWIFVTLLAVHLLGHVWEAALISRTELRRTLGGPAARNRRLRFGLLVASLVLGVAAAILLLPHATSWTNRPADRGDRFGPPPVGAPAFDH